jgi:hypothetical protein
MCGAGVLHRRPKTHIDDRPNPKGFWSWGDVSVKNDKKNDMNIWGG